MNDDPLRARLSDMIGGYRSTALVSTAARLGLPDRLAEGRGTAQTLAGAVGVREDLLQQFMRALVTIGVLEQHEDLSFGLTPLGRLLRADIPGSLRSAAIYFGQVSAPSFAVLPDVLRSGRSGFQHCYGTDFYGYLDAHPELIPHYNTMIAVDGLGAAIASCNDFSGARTVVDVGGGRGVTLRDLLSECPHLAGVLQETAHVIEDVKDVLDDPRLAGRSRTVSRNFFDCVEPGGDVYLLVRVLPNWDDEHASRILQRCREAMSPGTRLLIVDMAVAERAEPGSAAAVGDLLAMVHFGSTLRGKPALTALLEPVGLRLSGIRSLPGFPSLTQFEAVIAA
ncbi:MAG TPA: methyltransferase [Streptosporangiaceae bacterium]